ncbi:MAG: DUF3153 domain-containing protein [Vulcanococcus sp.]
MTAEPAHDEELPAPPADALLDPARIALERGDYGQCLVLLQPLAEAHSAATPFGGSVRLLMATAQMGQGDSTAAAASCRSLRACRDSTLRAMARDLQEVLEAPALQRPREWSMTLPSLGEMQPLEGEFKAMARSRRRRRGPEEPPPPPTGPTRAPLGFALVAIALLLLTALLGGCVQLETDVRLPAPGRLQISQTSLSTTGRPLPWQRQLAEALRGTPLRVSADAGRQTLTSPVLPAQEALALWRTSLETGARLAGQTLPAPQLRLNERNWLLGVRQELQIELDLRQLEALPGLSLRLDLEPLRSRAVRRAEPLPAVALLRRSLGHGSAPPRLRWTLQPGAINRLEIACWRWSRLGLGGLAVALLLVLVSVLQRLRLAAGFGLPQLPA